MVQFCKDLYEYFELAEESARRQPDWDRDLRYHIADIFLRKKLLHYCIKHQINRNSRRAEYTWKLVEQSFEKAHNSLLFSNSFLISDPIVLCSIQLQMAICLVFVQQQLNLNKPEISEMAFCKVAHSSVHSIVNK